MRRVKRLAWGTQTAPGSGTYRYDPYGASLGIAPDSFGYRSGHMLSGGLIHYSYRHYDPIEGRWTQRDPVTHSARLGQEQCLQLCGREPGGVLGRSRNGFHCRGDRPREDRCEECGKEVVGTLWSAQEAVCAANDVRKYENERLFPRGGFPG